MRVGDKVKSINPEGSVQAPGSLMGIIDADWFLTHMSEGVSEENLNNAWKKYPNWKEKPVCLVAFDEPHKISTLAEWVENAERMKIPRNLAVDTYKDCPTTDHMAFPYEDIEVLD